MRIIVIKGYNKITKKEYYSEIRITIAKNESSQLFYDRLTNVFPNIPEHIKLEASHFGKLTMPIKDLNRYDDDDNLKLDLEDMFTSLNNLTVTNQK